MRQNVLHVLERVLERLHDPNIRKVFTCFHNECYILETVKKHAKLIDKKIKLVSHEVTDLNDELQIYDKLVVCAGINSKKLASTIGENLAIYPVKGYSITINDPGKNAPWVSLLDDQSKIVTSRLGKKRLRIAGTAEFNGYNLDIIQNRVRPLIKWCTDMFPNINADDIKPWAGLRPMAPNMLPITRISRDSRVWFNTGHGTLGWTLSHGTAQLLTDMIAGRETALDVKPYKIKRSYVSDRLG